LGVLIVAALAAAPGPLSVSPEPADAAEQYRVWASSKGASGEAAEVACRELAGQGPKLCLRVEDEERRRYVTRADLAAWGLTHAEAEAAAVEVLTASPWELRELDGGGSWWEIPVNDVSALAALAHPRWFPGDLVAMPSRSTLLAWRSDGGELDHIMLVAVRRAYEAADDPVSPVVLRWGDSSWGVFGQARPAE